MNGKLRGYAVIPASHPTFHGDFAAVEAVLKREKPDFVQIDYAIDDREVERRILPLAAEVQAAVLTAQPLGRGQLFAPCAAKHFLTGPRISRIAGHNSF